jgi:ABC-type multidrug transport system ATPase subunit
MIEPEARNSTGSAEAVAIDIEPSKATIAGVKSEDDDFATPMHRQLSTPVEQLRLEFADISYTLPPDKKAKKAATNGEPPVGKTLIHPISGVVEPGRMLAIMGSSGAGKSTLLDLLAARISAKRYSGTVTLNGKTYPPGQFRRHTTYVMQDDALYPLLTVRETFRYAARLRVGDHKGKAHIETLVTETLTLLGLEDCADVSVGDMLHKG